MSNRHPRVLGSAAVALALSVVAVGLGMMLASSETLLRSTFAAALSPAATAMPVRAAAASPLAGSEEFWLTAMKGNGAAPLSKAVSVGDRIAMTLDGKERRLDVVSVSEFTPAKTEIDTRSGAVRLVLVTAHDASDATLRPIRFVMELEAAPLPVVPRPGRTL